jgi:hypothetical protein
VPYLFATVHDARHAVHQAYPGESVADGTYLPHDLAVQLHYDFESPHRITRTSPRPPIIEASAPVMLPVASQDQGLPIPDTHPRWYWHPLDPRQPTGPTIAWTPDPAIGDLGIRLAGRREPTPNHPTGRWRPIQWAHLADARRDFAHAGIWAQRAPRIVPIDLQPWFHHVVTPTAPSPPLSP